MNAMTQEELLEKARSMKLPTMGGLQKAELAARLSLYDLWCKLPPVVLLNECGEPQPDLHSTDDEETHRSILLATLLVRKWCARTYNHSTGWQLEKIEEPHLALEALRDWENIQSMQVSAVREHYTSL
eukprot:3850017-Amphidinium_carterae.1